MRNIINRIFFFKKNNFKKGAALLFSIMLSGSLLVIVLGVLSIAVKEQIFSTSAKETNKAFFAADSGIECALYYNTIGRFPAGGGSSSVINCAESGPINVNLIHDSVDSSEYTFSVVGLGNANSCANVTVLSEVGTTTITSLGYNVGQSASCNQSGLGNIERKLQATIVTTP